MHSEGVEGALQIRDDIRDCFQPHRDPHHIVARARLPSERERGGEREREGVGGGGERERERGGGRKREGERESDKARGRGREMVREKPEKSSVGHSASVIAPKRNSPTKTLPQKERQPQKKNTRLHAPGTVQCCPARLLQYLQ